MKSMIVCESTFLENNEETNGLINKINEGVNTGNIIKHTFETLIDSPDENINTLNGKGDCSDVADKNVCEKNDVVVRDPRDKSCEKNCELDHTSVQNTNSNDTSENVGGKKHSLELNCNVFVKVGVENLQKKNEVALGEQTFDKDEEKKVDAVKDVLESNLAEDEDGKLESVQILSEVRKAVCDVKVIDLDLEDETVETLQNVKKDPQEEKILPVKLKLKIDEEEESMCEEVVLNEKEVGSIEECSTGIVPEDSRETSKCEIEIACKAMPDSGMKDSLPEEEASVEALPGNPGIVAKRRSCDRLLRPMPKSKKLSLIQKGLQKTQESVAGSNEEIATSTEGDTKSEVPESKEPNGTELIKENEADPSSAETNSSRLTGNCVNGKRRRKRFRTDLCLTPEELDGSVSEGTRAKKKKLKGTIDGESDVNSSSLQNTETQEANAVASTEACNSEFGRAPSRNDSLLERTRRSSTGLQNKQISNAQEKKKSTSNFLANLRGTLKSLTRSDLEELIVQKLCEVITERSTVGELRRKAQALEDAQERWRSKVASLNKQMREMEMVMKKYLTEVQKQTKENGGHLVVPLRVTRSVGLQVSFYSNSSKTQKPSSQQAQVSGSAVTAPATPSVPVPAHSSAHLPAPQIGQSLNSKYAKLSSPKISPTSVLHPSFQAKSKPCALNQKAPAGTPQKSPSLLQNSVKQITRVDFGNAAQSAKAPGTALATKSSRQRHSDSYKYASGMQNHQPQQNGSKVIDLTDDDDRQSSRTAITTGINNNTSQSQVPQNNKLFILPNTTVTPTSTPPGQNLQVLITTPATPQPRQVVSVPPLLFKSNNSAQTPAQASNSPSNQTNRAMYSKILKHPAPLPQQPAYQTRTLQLLPPRPALKISKVQSGIVLSWNMSLRPEHAPISSYQLYAYQEGSSPPATSLWKKVGDVKALPLPMACTLTQFMSGHKYHFAVRAVDHLFRVGPFSYPGTIVLVK